MLLVLAAHLVQPRHEFRQGPLALDQPLGDLAMQLFGGFDRLGGFPPLLLQVVGPGAERHDLAAVAFDLFVQVLAAVALVLDRRFLGGDPLAIGGNLGLAAADLFVDLGGLDVQGQHLGLGRFGGGQGGVALGGQIADLALDFGQPLAQPPPVDQADLRAQLLQPIGVFLVAPRLAGLGPHAAEAAFHFVDDVRQPQQVLLDPLQPPQGLELLELEAADAGGLFEDHAAVLGRRLQEHVDLALLDHAVGLRAQAGAGQQVADVAEPAGIAIDQVLALAAAIDPPRDVDLRRIDGQEAVGVVEA